MKVPEFMKSKTEVFSVKTKRSKFSIKIHDWALAVGGVLLVIWIL